MVDGKKIKFLRNYYGLSPEVVADFLNLSLQLYLQAENGEIEFELSAVKKLGVLFLQSYEELLENKNPIVKKTLPYSLKNITLSNCEYAYKIAKIIMAHEDLIERYNNYATQINKTRLNVPVFTEKQFYQTFENYYEEDALDLIVELPKIKNFTLLIMDMKELCDSFSYNINNHYLIAINSNLTKEKANLTIAKELVYSVLVQKSNNKLAGLVKTESLVNYANKIATKLLLKDDKVMAYVKSEIKSYLFNQDIILKIAKHFVVEPYKINELLDSLKIENERVNGNGASSLKMQGYKNYAHGEYHLILNELYNNDVITTALYQNYKTLVE